MGWMVSILPASDCACMKASSQVKTHGVGVHQRRWVVRRVHCEDLHSEGLNVLLLLLGEVGQCLQLQSNHMIYEKS